MALQPIATVPSSSFNVPLSIPTQPNALVAINRLQAILLNREPCLLNLSQIIQQLAPPLLFLAIENTTTEVPICVLVRVAKGQESSLVSLRFYLEDLPLTLPPAMGLSSHPCFPVYSSAR